MTPDHPNDVRRVTEYSICPQCGAKFGTVHIALCGVYLASKKKTEAATLRAEKEKKESDSHLELMGRVMEKAVHEGSAVDDEEILILHNHDPHTPFGTPDHMPGVDVGEDPVTERNVVSAVPDRQYLNKPLDPIEYPVPLLDSDKSIDPIPANPDAILDATSPDPGSGKGKASSVSRVPTASGGQRIFLASKDKQRDPDGIPARGSRIAVLHGSEAPPIPGSPRDEVQVLKSLLADANLENKRLKRRHIILIIVLGAMVAFYVVPKIIMWF